MQLEVIIKFTLVVMYHVYFSMSDLTYIKYHLLERYTRVLIRIIFYLFALYIHKQQTKIK